MGILTIKLNDAQRDALVSLVRARIYLLSSYIETDEPGYASEQAGYASEQAALRETLAELTERARDYSAETRFGYPYP